jgi:hypothetical protein
VVGRRGIARLSKERGAVGDTVVVTPRSGTDDWQIDLEYRGVATISPRGERVDAGRAYKFSYSRFEPTVDWTVRFVAWPDSADPRKHDAEFTKLLERAPLVTQHAPRLDYMWYSPTVKGVPQSKFAVVATGRVELPSGVYTLQTISDDAVRVWIDGKLAVDHWAPHESAVDTTALTGGAHDLRVEYYQVDGWTELRLDILRGRRRAGGSPGPH